MKVLTVIGARPQFMKAWPTSRALAAAGIEEFVVHTGQHYDDRMSAQFFRELGLREPALNLGVGSGSHGAQTAKMLEALEAAILAQRPDWVLVYGDTNSTLAGALAAAKLHVPIAHVEAGLRSFNRAMPEEINRVLTDQVSARLFCPSRVAVENLGREGITRGVHLVGDVMFDALRHFSRVAETRSTALRDLQLEPGSYYLATVHRAENTDDPARLHALLTTLASLDRTVVLPLHPRTRAVLERHGDPVTSATLSDDNAADADGRSQRREPEGGPGAPRAVQRASTGRPRAERTAHLPTAWTQLEFIEPAGYLDMLTLTRHARAVLTDSGGLQKEAFWLGVPCVTLRNETEWIETLEGGWNQIAGADAEKIRAALARRPTGERAPHYGHGQAAEKIAGALTG